MDEGIAVDSPIARITALAFVLLAISAITGCYAPLHSAGIPASTLPDQYRLPMRTGGPLLNYTALTAEQPQDYYLGPDDIIQVTIPELFAGANFQPLEVQVMQSGEVQLPLVGSVNVGYMNLLQAQQAITTAYADGYFNAPRVSVSLVQKATVNVVVLGKVVSPGVVSLPRYENDVAHAIATAGGFAEDAAEVIEIHHKPSLNQPEIVTINLRGSSPNDFTAADVVLSAGDVLVVPSRRNEVFYVVGELNPNNTVRFTAGERERELGGGFILPRDREIDVVTAVAMAGYIDPIESPTTVTVHRQVANGQPMLIHVDLIKARYCREENVNVAPGDIIYLNPDGAWYFRRTFDRLIDDVLLLPYRSVLGLN